MSLSKTMDAPGPGSYQNVKEFGQGVSNMTIGQKRDLKIDNTSPGPGQYNANSNVVKSSMTSFKQGTSNRSQIVSKQVLESPGPGNYSFENQNIGKNVKSFKIGERGPSNDRTDSPGPGAYNPSMGQIKDQIKGFSIKDGTNRTDIIDKNTKNAPGPGSYSVDKGNNGPSFKFHPAREESIDNSSPGPGKYDANSSVIKDRVISYKINSSTERTQIVQKDNNQNLGPGQYSNSKSEFGQNVQKVSIRGRPRDLSANDSPGPGNYNVSESQTKNKVVNTIFSSKSERSQLATKIARDQPGPGVYETPHKTIGKDAKSFTIGGKAKDRQKDQTPGPGSYDQGGKERSQVRDKSPSFKIGTSNRDSIVNKLLQDMPGPGNYTQSSIFGKNTPSYTMGKKQESIQKKDVPGPGNYEADSSIIKDRVISHKIGGGQQRSQLVSRDEEDKPGPGHYQNNDKDISRNTSPSFAFKGRSKEVADQRIPGPGQYDVSNSVSKDRVISYKMSNQTRQDMVSKSAKEMPGPGNYDSPHKTIGSDALKYTIGTKSRERVASGSPGPGHYQPTDSLSKDRIKSYNMMGGTERTDLVMKSAKELPGPGQYQQNSKQIGKDVQSFTMRGKQRDKVGNENPGPGNYEPSSTQNRDRVISHKMDNKSQRSQLVSKDDKNKPGPGSYAQTDQQFGSKAVSFTMKGRPQDMKTEAIPGPGTYNGTSSQIKDRVISHKINKSERIEIVSKNEKYKPGPGEYDSPHKTFGKDSKSFVMRGRPEDNNRNDSPGPGAYSPSQNVNKDKVISYKMGSEKRSEIVSKEQSNLPGPGIYNSSHKTIGKDVQSFTIGGKVEDKQRFDSPGPGAYEPQSHLSKDKVVSYKIGSEQRSQIVSKEQSNLPGPGVYNSPHKTIGKDVQSFTIGVRQDDNSRNDSPGPGAYDPQQYLSRDRVITHQISSSKRADIVSKEAKNLPGPGNYYDADKKKSVISYTMGSKAEDKQRNDSPGPGAYESSSQLNKDKIISFKMGNEQRSQIVSKEQSNLPGPGVYNSSHKTFGKDSQSFKIGVRQDDTQRNDSPGPGAYEPSQQLQKDKVISYKMGSEQRSQIVSKEQSSLPGPGVYNSPHKTIGKDAQGFTIGQRKDDTQRNDSPGPGAYDSSYQLSKDKVISHKIGNDQRSQIVSKEQQNLPGPGVYDSPHKTIGKDVQSFTIGGKQEDRQRIDSPGPGAYDASMSASKERVISFQMGSAKRSEIVNKEQKNLPGPGVYDQSSKSIGKDGKSFAFQGRPEDKDRNDSPGPGNYEISMSQVKDKVISFDMGGKSQRSQLVSKETANQLGPGVYSSNNKEFGKGVQSFTMKGKPQDKKQDYNPAPGQYDPKDFLTKDTVKMTTISKTKRSELVTKSENEKLGPGIYSDNNKQFGKDTKSFTIQGRPKDDQRNDSPGPGNYEPVESQSRYQSPSYKISKTSRQEMVNSDQKSLPGPGNYNQESQIGKGKSFQIQGKGKSQRINDLPGPGQYNANISVVKDTIKSAKIDSKTQRTLFVKSEQQQLGPGFYDISDKKDGPSFQMRGRPKDSIDNNIPGPGSYNANHNAVKDRIIQGGNFSNSPPRDTSKSISPNRDSQLGVGGQDARDYNLPGHDSISYTFKKTEYREHDDGNPGPGYYKIPCKIADVPEYSIPDSKRQVEFKYV